MSRAAIGTAATIVVAALAVGCGPPAREAGPASPSATPVATSPPSETGSLQLRVEPSRVRPRDAAVLVLRHADGEPFEYGAEYTLHRLTDSGWEPYDECEGLCAWPMWLAIVRAGDEGRQDITAPREPGRYRITKSAHGAGTASVELEVVAGG